jgi:hypothetical protein
LKNIKTENTNSVATQFSFILPFLQALFSRRTYEAGMAQSQE